MSMIEGLKKGALLTGAERADIIQNVYWGRPGERPTVIKVAYEIAKAQQDEDFKAFGEWLDKPRCEECGGVL